MGYTNPNVSPPLQTKEQFIERLKAKLQEWMNEEQDEPKEIEQKPEEIGYD